MIFTVFSVIVVIINIYGVFSKSRHYKYLEFPVIVVIINIYRVFSNSRHYQYLRSFHKNQLYIIFTEMEYTQYHAFIKHWLYDHVFSKLKERRSTSCCSCDVTHSLSYCVVQISSPCISQSFSSPRLHTYTEHIIQT